MNRSETLDRAKAIVTGERTDQYGSPEDNFARIAGLWNAYLVNHLHGSGLLIMPADVAAMMALLKIARIATGTGTDDSWVDLAGYAACGAELSKLQADCAKPQAEPPLPVEAATIMRMWPRFEDGEPVLFGDRLPGGYIVERISIDSSGVTRLCDRPNGESITMYVTTTAERPVKRAKALAGVS